MLRRARRAGPQSAVFRNHVDQAVQIDFVFVRIPCNVPQLKNPETGFRHYPIELEVPCPVLPHTAKTSIMTAKVACQRLSHAETAELFSNQVQQLIPRASLWCYVRLLACAAHTRWEIPSGAQCC